MSPPAALIVEHSTDKPSEDCAVAGLLLARLVHGSAESVSFARLRDRDVAFRQPGSAEHVMPDGRLVDNSVLWVDRGASSRARFVEVADLSALDATGSMVVAVNRVLAPHVAMPDLAGRLRSSGHTMVRLRAATRGDEVAVTASDDDGADRHVADARRDAFGRWRLKDRGLDAVLADRFGIVAPSEESVAAAASNRPEAHLLVIGESAHLRDVFPAVLAALGDAADHADLAARTRIVSPKGLTGGNWPACLEGADGLVLPGGSDLDQVDGQVAAASVAMAGGLPTVGLCLGMQSMAVAVARTTPGFESAHLAEVDPDGPCPLFQRLKDGNGDPAHKVGAGRLRIVPGTRLAACCGDTTLLERLNHRHALTDADATPLRGAGLRVCARLDDGSAIEGVEVSAHPFFIGLQSHPELSSRPAAPHPLLAAFLGAAASRRASGSSADR